MSETLYPHQILFDPFVIVCFGVMCLLVGVVPMYIEYILAVIMKSHFSVLLGVDPFWYTIVGCTGIIITPIGTHLYLLRGTSI